MDLSMEMEPFLLSIIIITSDPTVKLIHRIKYILLYLLQLLFIPLIQRNHSPLY